jgi:hypothetical protein
MSRDSASTGSRGSSRSTGETADELEASVIALAQQSDRVESELDRLKLQVTEVELEVQRKEQLKKRAEEKARQLAQQAADEEAKRAREIE